ncbi:MAG: MBL fold metallo-hydrolase [Nitrospirales bacterium]
MASVKKRLSTNVDGEFFVDATCINCDTCRQVAPATFVENGEYSSVYRQPKTDGERLQAYQALLACPVGSIGAESPNHDFLRAASASFPRPIDGEVCENGYTSRKSFGAQSYFIRHPDGNWLIDSPRYVPQLVEAFARMGGVRYLFLSHEDDVADAGRYAKRFGATRIIHEADAEAEPEAEYVVTGNDPVTVSPGFLILPVPGHTPGSLALLYRNRYLFTGDHLLWDRETRALRLATVYVWSEAALRRSTERLLAYSFEWVLPGHGDRLHLPAAAMRRELERLLAARGV